MEYVLCAIIPILLVSIIVVIVFRKSSGLYWLSLIALYIQALILIFKFRFVLDTATYFNLTTFLMPNDLGMKLAMAFAVVPFSIPAILAYFTAVITSNPAVGIASLIFYSIVQVIIQGMLSGQNIFNEKLKQGIKYALPVLSLLLSFAQIFGENQFAIFNLGLSDFLFILTICCCQVVLGIGVIVLLALAFTQKGNKRSRS